MDIIYHTAAVGIVMDKNGQQRFYQEHTDDISCLDTYENTVATGQLGPNPLICIWDAVTMNTKVVFKGIL